MITVMKVFANKSISTHTYMTKTAYLRQRGALKRPGRVCTELPQQFEKRKSPAFGINIISNAGTC